MKENLLNHRVPLVDKMMGIEKKSNKEPKVTKEKIEFSRQRAEALLIFSALGFSGVVENYLSETAFNPNKKLPGKIVSDVIGNIRLLNKMCDSLEGK